jgi:hypothetical protein
VHAKTNTHPIPITLSLSIFIFFINMSESWTCITINPSSLIALLNHVYTLDFERNFRDNSGNACGREFRENYVGTYGCIQRQPKMTPSPQICPLSIFFYFFIFFIKEVFLLPVMYITIYPFTIALINHTYTTNYLPLFKSI